MAAAPDPYTGPTIPEGAFGAAAVGGGPVEMDIPAGEVVVWTYRVRGKPAAAGWSSFGAAGSRKWHLPDIGVSVMPADDGTPRLQEVTPERRWLQIEVRRRGYSEKSFGYFVAPAPGGRYRADVTGVVEDDEAHVLFAPPA